MSQSLMGTRFSFEMRKYCRIWCKFWLLDIVNVLNATLCPKLYTSNTYLIVFYKFYLTLFKKRKKYCHLCVWGSTFVNKDIIIAYEIFFGSTLNLSLLGSTLSSFFSFSTLFQSLWHRENAIAFICSGLCFIG